MNMSIQIKKCIFFSIIGLLISFYHCKSLPFSTEPPNIVLIIGDDIGWNDLGCYRNNVVQTPNIDRMAKGGMRFTNAFLTTSQCSPTRCSIISGRYPHNTGAAELHTPLPASIQVFPELLKNAGYYTAQAGKWHMGDHAKRGFDLVHDEGKNVNGDGGEDMWVDVLQGRPKEKPFFMWFASFDAHRPWGPNPHSNSVDPGKVIPPPYLIDEEGTRQDLAKYYGEIARFDHSIGEVEKELDKQGVLDNTIIIVISDNGRPFPRCKTWLYDDGVRTPMIIKWPMGITQEGKVCQSLISVIDLAPTILKLSGVNILDCFQGRSFADLFHDPSLPFRNYVFAEHNWHDYESYERMVRTKDYLYLINRRPALSNGSNGGLSDVSSFTALIKAREEGQLSVLQNDVFVPRPPEAFFDCGKDYLQEHNLIDDVAFASEINGLRNMLKRWQAETGDTEPEHLTPDWYERETETGKRVQSWGFRGEMPGTATRADTICAKGPF